MASDSENRGTACTVRIEADKEAKIQLVLDGVSITNDDFPAIYVVSADKVFITMLRARRTYCRSHPGL